MYIWHYRSFAIRLILAIASLTHLANAQLVVDDQKRKEQVLFNGQVQVPAGKLYSLPFTTTTNFVNGRIAGNVQAAGGSGNDIRVVVTKDQKLIYDSERRRSVVLSVDVSEPGQYALIFDNSFSLISDKGVAGRISLVHWGMDAQKNVADQQAASEHQRRGMRIIQRLYATLKANEKVWGTTQLFAVPSLRVANDQSINAGANWSSNVIQINRGTFEFSDRTGDKSDDVLAAILAHELGHIFYRHPGYGSGSGVKGFFDELKGVTELDRVQEKEADILGIRIACQAGFAPEGMLLLMQKFSEQDRTANSFMRNHPTGVERFNYLQGETGRCQALQSRQLRSYPAGSTDQVNETVKSTATAAELPKTSWKLVQNNSLWTFKVGRQFLYGEHSVSEEQRAMGDFDTVDLKKEGDGFIGVQRVRTTFQIKNQSTQGFSYKACEWEFAVEISSVTEDRLEGRWEGYARGVRVNPSTCGYSGQRIWEDAAWIRN